jgi:hypothetical protein
MLRFLMLQRKQAYTVDERSDFKKSNDDSCDATAYLRAKLVGLMHVSTWQGVPNMARAPSWIVKSIWIFLFMASFGYAIFNTVLTLQSYMEREILIKYEKRQDYGTLTFPACTICNLSP